MSDYARRSDRYDTPGGSNCSGLGLRLAGQYAVEPGQEKVSDPESKRYRPRWDPFQDYLILDTERDYQAEHAGR
ncbi:hypothetical protein IG631_17220 [Alternaria alternata]|nr:hypothetical protein IG631_17220 [Alternaria alternata]